MGPYKSVITARLYLIQLQYVSTNRSILQKYCIIVYYFIFTYSIGVFPIRHSGWLFLEECVGSVQALSCHGTFNLWYFSCPVQSFQHSLGVRASVGRLHVEIFCADEKFRFYSLSNFRYIFIHCFLFRGAGYIVYLVIERTRLNIASQLSISLIFLFIRKATPPK